MRSLAVFIFGFIVIYIFTLTSSVCYNNCPLPSYDRTRVFCWRICSSNSRRLYLFCRCRNGYRETSRGKTFRHYRYCQRERRWLLLNGMITCSVQIGVNLISTATEHQLSSASTQLAVVSPTDDLFSYTTEQDGVASSNQLILYTTNPDDLSRPSLRSTPQSVSLITCSREDLPLEGTFMTFMDTGRINDYVTGATLTLQCIDGYRIQKDITTFNVFCGGNGVWLGLNAVCKRCQCPCKRTQNLVVITDKAVLEEKVQELTKSLTLQKENLASQFRKKISATDKRKSAASIGQALGFGIICFIAGAIMILDLPVIFKHLRYGPK